MKKRKIALIILLTLIVVYFLGPTPPSPQYNTEIPELPSIEKLEDFVNLKEAQFHTRPGNEAQIVWLDSNKSKTDYSILYLHGFSACHMEGNPIHMNLAKEFGANLYLARLQEHGLISDNNLENYSPDGVWESAKEALFIAKKLGNKVIVISTSTGSPIALKLAAEYPETVNSLINLSPNFRIKDPMARILNDPWGLQIAGLVIGEKRHVIYENEEAKKYWDTLYSVKSMVSLEELIETTTTEEILNNITCPVLSLYYFKDEAHQDNVVDVSVIPLIHSKMKSAPGKNIHKALSTPGNHVIGSSIQSKDYNIVEEEIREFLISTLELSPKNPSFN